MKAAQACFEQSPGDADTQIEIVNALRDAGRGEEAEAVYARAKAVYANQAAAYPDSGPARNLAAWFQGRCRRDLDDALAHAKRAAELEPTNTAILDTLAEVHFQRGETEPALALVRQCIELEPTNEHHRKNLVRFQQAGKGGPATKPGP